MKYNLLKFSFFILLLCVDSCIEPFSPPEVNSDEKYLVVDGFLNAGSDTSKIELRRTQNTNDGSAISVETGAKISVEMESGTAYSFTEKGKGAYFLPPINVNLSGKYRLRIKTAGGKEYMSDYVPVTTTPPIDSLGSVYDAERDAMVIKVNTHDPTNKTRFYKWKFEETYQYRAAYYSTLVIDTKKNEIVYRNEDINLCWKSAFSTNITLGSTIKLSADAIRDLPINVVPISTNKFYIKYSILVKQFGLTQDAFEYWTALAKTTQGTGSLFDPQPSQVTGNIKNIANPKELVFGYFSASRETSKRIFLTPNRGLYPRCDPPDTLSVADALKASGIMLISYQGERMDSVLTTSSFCADCRAQGGTNIRPPFWQ
ncbi:DUF4249 domain-containing protein [Dyadobacter psychrotolerans]|uniref:DUF4249 domain-containing protein n=1 Tax=Dyadobacter psychrotolerans TaxID=2541721 RepID=A0A4R5DJ59_9BACT|nr:DUF4249 domain-containing protein [Dyadobacter psychrotolerans]TDE11984.1 DUF4249 domain-containing protein [Dyadobacter psychrotolerans]